MVVFTIFEIRVVCTAPYRYYRACLAVTETKPCRAYCRKYLGYENYARAKPASLWVTDLHLASGQCTVRCTVISYFGNEVYIPHMVFHET